VHPLTIPNLLEVVNTNVPGNWADSDSRLPSVQLQAPRILQLRMQ
jgi:hypothetical protein